jgi:putative sterol carrier protein
MEMNDILSKLANIYESNPAEKFTGNIQVELTGEKSGDWFLAFQDGKCQVFDGKTEQPTLTVSCDSAVFNDLLQGSADPVKAYMSGKIKVTGNVMVLMKLVSLAKSSD